MALEYFYPRCVTSATTIRTEIESIAKGTNQERDCRPTLKGLNCGRDLYKYPRLGRRSRSKMQFGPTAKSDVPDYLNARLPAKLPRAPECREAIGSGREGADPVDALQISRAQPHGPATIRCPRILCFATSARPKPSGDSILDSWKSIQITLDYYARTMVLIISWGVFTAVRTTNTLGNVRVRYDQLTGEPLIASKYTA